MELRKLSKIDAKSKGIYDRTRANGKSHYHKLPAIHRSSLIDETKENQKCRNFTFDYWYYKWIERLFKQFSFRIQSTFLQEIELFGIKLDLQFRHNELQKSTQRCLCVT